MVVGDYTIEATRAIVEERLREARHARLVKQVRSRAAELITTVIASIAIH